MSSIIISGPSANYAFTPKQHFELGEALGQMDFETAAKLSGARFVVLKGGLARLERALGAIHARRAYERARLHRGQSAAAGARRGDVRHGAIAEVRGRSVPRLGADFWLIPTAEVPLTNLVRESIVDEAQLPMRLTACTPCFRAEAGAAGKDTRGMIRQHQFTKVELVSITTPEQSRDEHERMLSAPRKCCAGSTCIIAW